MGTSIKEDNDFRDALISTTFLEEAIDWINKNMNPEDIFDSSSLNNWAVENGYLKS